MVAKIAEVSVPEWEQEIQYSRHWDENAPGMDDIRLVREIARRENMYYRPKNKIVGSFGIKDSDGHDLLINWKVDGYRKDGSHGALSPGLPSDYGKSLFESMFKRW